MVCHQQSSLQGSQKPLIKNCAVGNELSNFVSEASNRWRFGLISEYKKTNLFRIELMFSCPIIGRFQFFSLVLVRTFFFNFYFQVSPRYYLLSLSSQNQTLSTEGYSGSILLSFTMPGHPFTFQELFIEPK